MFSSETLSKGGEGYTKVHIGRAKIFNFWFFFCKLFFVELKKRKNYRRLEFIEAFFAVCIRFTVPAKENKGIKLVEKDESKVFKILEAKYILKIEEIL